MHPVARNTPPGARRAQVVAIRLWGPCAGRYNPALAGPAGRHP